MLMRGVAALAGPLSVLLLGLFACLGGCAGGTVPDPASPANVAVPGVDTQDFTPRERRELERYLRETPAPCADVAVPVGTCVIEKRSCSACLPEAQAIAKAVREGMAAEQVAALVKQRFDPAGAKALPLEGSPSRGPEQAPVTLVEFADFECPFCQRVAPELERLWESRKDKIRFVFKFMPLAMHPHGEAAARAAIAAQAQGKFWEMDRQLFASGTRLEASDLEGYARDLGLDVDRFRADMTSPATTARIEADRKLADAMGVRGTPTLYINGREFDMKLDLAEWVDAEAAAAAKK
jgi:protein-disulfide isomerase